MSIRLLGHCPYFAVFFPPIPLVLEDLQPRHSTIFSAVPALLLPFGPVSSRPCLTQTDLRKHAVRGVFSQPCDAPSSTRRSLLRGSPPWSPPLSPQDAPPLAPATPIVPAATLTIPGRRPPLPS